jgi:hypothetical protein
VAQGVEHTPDWLFGTLPFEMIFSTWDEVKAYLMHIAHDPVVDRLNRWYFFQFTGEHVRERNPINKRKAGKGKR